METNLIVLNFTSKEFHYSFCFLLVKMLIYKKKLLIIYEESVFKAFMASAEPHYIIDLMK